MADEAVEKVGDGDRENNIVATGALFALLSEERYRNNEVVTHLDIPDTNGSNQIEIGFAFLKSKYRVTVERIPDVGEAR